MVIFRFSLWVILSRLSADELIQTESEINSSLASSFFDVYFNGIPGIKVSNKKDLDLLVPMDSVVKFLLTSAFIKISSDDLNLVAGWIFQGCLAGIKPLKSLYFFPINVTKSIKVSLWLVVTKFAIRHMPWVLWSVYSILSSFGVFVAWPCTASGTALVKCTQKHTFTLWSNFTILASSKPQEPNPVSQHFWLATSTLLLVPCLLLYSLSNCLLAKHRLFLKNGR